MNAWEITGIVVGGLFVLLIVVNAKDIFRYIKILSM